MASEAGTVSTGTAEEVKVREEAARPFINLTPHAIHIYKDGAVFKTYEASGKTVRMITDEEKRQEVVGPDGVPMIEDTNFIGISGLPEDDAPIIVSMIAGKYLKDNEDIYAGEVYGPDTDVKGVVSDEKGAIIGTKRLVIYKKHNSRLRDLAKKIVNATAE